MRLQFLLHIHMSPGTHCMHLSVQKALLKSEGYRCEWAECQTSCVIDPGVIPWFTVPSVFFFLRSSGWPFLNISLENGCIPQFRCLLTSSGTERQLLPPAPHGLANYLTQELFMILLVHNYILINAIYLKICSSSFVFSFQPTQFPKSFVSRWGVAFYKLAI